jgi:glucosamine kinase
MTIKKHLGLDVGGSATRWCFSHGSSVQSGETIGFSGHLSRPDVFQKAQTALADIVTNIGAVDAVIAGVSGLSKGTEEGTQLEQLIRHSLNAKDIHLMSDIELATRTAFPQNNGILVYAGTGSIAAHIDSNGHMQTAGGKGVLIDDAGGGYWIAVAAMRHVLRTDDEKPGSGWQTILGKALAARLGGSAWPEVRTAFYGLDRGGVALLAMAVAEAAEAGDKNAIAIFRDAGQELGNLGKTLMIRTGCRKIALAGRASLLHPSIHDAIQGTLKGVEVRSLHLNCAKTALILAQDLYELSSSARSEP